MKSESYSLKHGERNVSDEGFRLMEEYRRTHDDATWDGSTHELLVKKYGDAVRHVPGYGWVLTSRRYSRKEKQEIIEHWDSYAYFRFASDGSVTARRRRNDDWEVLLTPRQAAEYLHGGLKP